MNHFSLFYAIVFIINSLLLYQHPLNATNQSTIDIPHLIPYKPLSNSIIESLKKFYHQKKVAVTGGSGFIGSHIVDALVALGAQVTVIDNFSSGSLNNLEQSKNFISIKNADITELENVVSATKNCDVVFHLAALVSVPLSVKNPDFCTRVNIVGTFNTLEACRINNVKSFVFSSSAAVYGNTPPPNKESNVLHPESPYAMSKQIGETLCSLYANQYNISGSSLRYFNAYGNRQNPHGPYAGVVVKFATSLKNNEIINIFGDGLQTRDFVHVKKIVEANLIMGMLPTQRGDIYNIGNGSSITLLQLLAQLETALSINHRGLTLAPARDGDVKHSRADCSKYENLLATLNK